MSESSGLSHAMDWLLYGRPRREREGEGESLVSFGLVVRMKGCHCCYSNLEKEANVTIIG